MNKFMHHLDLVLEDEAGWNPAEEAAYLVSKLNRANKQLSEAQNGINQLKSKLIVQLVKSLRKKAPSLNMAVDRDKCKIGHDDDKVTCEPDVNKERWVINKSKQESPEEHAISSNIQEIIASLLSYFMQSNPSFNESDCNNGKLLIEGKAGNLIDLVKWENKLSPLPSRARRMAHGG